MTVVGVVCLLVAGGLYSFGHKSIVPGKTDKYGKPKKELTGGTKKAFIAFFVIGILNALPAIVFIAAHMNTGSNSAVILM